MSVQLPPVINAFYTAFRNYAPSSGFCVGNMDGLEIPELISLKDGGYIVCAEKICFQTDKIHFSGRTLLAGPSIDLTVKEIVLEGTQDNPVQVVSTALHLTTAVLKIKNVTFYVFDQMEFFLTAHVQSEIENVRLVKLELELAYPTNFYSEKTIAHWGSKQDLQSCIAQIPQSEFSQSIRINLESEPLEEKEIVPYEGSTPPKRTDFWKFFALSALALFYLFSQLYLGYLKHKRIKQIGGRFL